jgi:hypothetical protein
MHMISQGARVAAAASASSRSCAQPARAEGYRVLRVRFDRCRGCGIGRDHQHLTSFLFQGQMALF